MGFCILQPLGREHVTKRARGRADFAEYSVMTAKRFFFQTVDSGEYET
jgi:hypothetical protein